MLLALISAAAIAAPTSGNDICLAMIPPRLAIQLARDNPDYALPVTADAPLERLLANAEAGGWPCPFVVIGDFDGDGTLDRALVLKNKTDQTVRLIAARHVDGAWRVEAQKDWPLKIADVRIEPLEAGLYEQTKGSRDAAKQIDMLASIQSDRPGFLVGPIEGAKRAFFFVENAWRTISLDD